MKLNYKTWLMGAACAERMERRGLKAELSHGVNMDTRKPFCGVKITSLVDDSSTWTDEFPDCPICTAKIKKLLLKEIDDKVAELKAQGWTKEDFARALKKELD